MSTARSTVAARWLGRMVDLACRRAMTVVVAGVGIAALGAAYAMTHFEISTDLNSVLDAHLPWRAQAQHLEEQFPSQGDDLTVLLDAQTSELAEQAAQRLQAALQPQHELFSSVERRNGGAFFDREGLLYSSLEDVRQTTQALVVAQPLLAQVAADPSLRGLLASLELGTEATESSPQREADLISATARIQAVLTAADGVAPRFLSWQGLLNARLGKPADWRQYIEIIPRLDHGSTAPAAPAMHAIRTAAQALQLNHAHGVQLRITGSAAIADEELATLAESSGPIAVLMLLCMIGLLYAATRSWRVIAATLLTVACGATMSAAMGLWLFNRFSLISIAFLPLFVGLSIDFCIQIHARAAAERAVAVADQLKLAVRSVGGGLALATTAIAAGFLAFLPTSYRGIAELGLIAAIGIVVALTLSVSLWPALLVLARARVHAERHPDKLKKLDSSLRRWGRVVVVGATATTAAALLLLPLLRFDSDPMHLRNPRTEAVSSYYELSRSAETMPNSLHTMTGNAADAPLIAERLRRLPSVGEVTTLQTLVPDEQGQKLALIEDARFLLDVTLQPLAIAPTPTDEQLVASLREGAQRLRRYAGSSVALRTALAGLAQSLDALARDSVPRRVQVSHYLMDGLPIALRQIAASLEAAPITVDTLPTSLRRQWQTQEGVVRVEASPATALRDMASTAQFVAEVRSVAPEVSGDAVSAVEAGHTIVRAFAMAGVLSAVVIAILLLVTLRQWRAVALAIAPIAVAGVMTFASCALIGIPINLENMIALPLLLGIGVAFNIYMVAASRDGVRDLLSSSVSRGVMFSALTTGTSFATLMLSTHPGTSSMGGLLLIALVWILATTLIVTPALAHVLSSGPGVGKHAAEGAQC